VASVPRSSIAGTDPHALEQNYDLQLAVECVNAARAQVGIVRSNQFPQVSLDPNFSGGKTEQNIRSNIFSLAADVVFQLDLFGRYRRATEAARAQLLGTQDAQQTVILTLVSDVASDYFLLRDLDLQLEITNETVRTQEDSVKLTELRLTHGVGTRLDVLQSRQVLDTANAQIPDLERQIGHTEDAIKHPSRNLPARRNSGSGAWIRGPECWQWSENLPPQLPAGLPSDLLERRPEHSHGRTWLLRTRTSAWPRRFSFRKYPFMALEAGHGVIAFLGSTIPAPSESEATRLV
jgi:multidrug efflux system outer membrane protein